MILGPGDTPSGTTAKTSETRAYSRKDIEKLKKGLYQVRVVERSGGGHTIEDSVQERDVVYVLELADKMQRSLRDIRNESRSLKTIGCCEFPLRCCPRYIGH